jgi:hypothetical protein
MSRSKGFQPAPSAGGAPMLLGCLSLAKVMTRLSCGLPGTARLTTKLKGALLRRTLGR